MIFLSFSCSFLLSFLIEVFIVFQLLNCVQLCDPMDCSKPGFPVLHHLLEFAHTQVHWVNDAIQTSHPLLPLSPPALNLSQHQSLFEWICSLLQVPKCWSFSFSINPSNEYSGLISWILGLIGLIFMSLSQHHSLKASVLWCSAFFMAQLSHP